MEEGADLQLEEITELAQRLAWLIDSFLRHTVDALHAEGWNSGQTFALRAELVRVANCAERAKRRGGTFLP